ncbi:HAMP domain-containing sensor histidine kinase [Sediminibacterium sp.]|uniref:HAMP domain-containing sensor histidine kinase n=1 Tax=Sediminibacterium sp. TaxID=1917865 RepID=UPI002731EA60|nr:HAMP domain-containing sensor histidine kinase [Sediminibacterium sp.]MDP1972641.1 HAMP domain-containing sensor histidine kinase [Sediminibacterium sp.]MDP2421713.1 HAMP domain-containing sensor histidine kinase [Sediminibacterium sp.]
MIKTPLRNLSIRNKLFLSHFLILLITLIIILISVKVNDKRLLMHQMMTQLDDIRNNIGKQSEARQTFLLKDRFTESFYITGTTESIIDYNKLINKIDSSLLVINQNKLSKNSPISEKIVSITRNIHGQEVFFNRMVDSVKQLGMGSQGLIGALNQHKKELTTNNLIASTDLKKLDELSTLYLLEKNEKAAIQFDSLARKLLFNYSNNPSAETILEEYRKTFVRIVKLERSIGNSNQDGLQNELIKQSKSNDEQLQATLKSINSLYEEDVKRLEWIFYGLIAVTLIAGLLFSYLISMEITRPLIELNRATKEVVATKFKDDISPDFIDELRMDEIGQLAINFNLAIRKIRRSIKIIQDKSESLQTKNKQLLENEETLKMISAQKDKFLSIISHDMRAPLSSIISFLDYYKDNFKNFTEAEIEFVSSNLNTHVKKVVEMLDGLLMWSRSQTGEIQMNLQPIDLAQIIEDTVTVLNQSAVNKNIRIRTYLHSQLIWADKNMTAFIIRNILSNAIKFTGENGIIDINTKRNKYNAFVIIKDPGVGMTADALSKLFLDNVSYSTFGTANEKGIGLGLVLCKDFMNKMNGNIEIESIQGEGTTVNLLFPLVSRTD